MKWLIILSIMLLVAATLAQAERVLSHRAVAALRIGALITMFLLGFTLCE